jgi:hypothetical protein
MQEGSQQMLNTLRPDMQSRDKTPHLHFAALTETISLPPPP